MTPLGYALYIAALIFVLPFWIALVYYLPVPGILWIIYCLCRVASGCGVFGEPA